MFGHEMRDDSGMEIRKQIFAVSEVRRVANEV